MRKFVRNWLVRLMHYMQFTCSSSQLVLRLFPLPSSWKSSRTELFFKATEQTNRWLKLANGVMIETIFDRGWWPSLRTDLITEGEIRWKIVSDFRREVKGNVFERAHPQNKRFRNVNVGQWHKRMETWKLEAKKSGNRGYLIKERNLFSSFIVDTINYRWGWINVGVSEACRRWNFEYSKTRHLLLETRWHRKRFVTRNACIRYLCYWIC